MAKQVSEILVKLGIQGAEGLDKLSSAFRSLEKSIGPTDKVIQEARQSIIDFAGSGKQSIQTIQGQIDAFKGLQTQATIGGNVYRQLAGDVNRLSDSLKALKTDYEEVGRVAKRTDAQIAAEFPARKPEAFRKQLAALNRQLDQLSVSARAYGDALTEITIRETAFGRAQARQQVIAGAQAVRAPLIGAMQPQQQLPNTLAALQLRISELTQDFQNLDRAGAPYQDTLAEINRLQRELANATEDGNVDRKEEIRARIENYRQITAENAGLREQAAIRRSVERGRARATGQRVIEQPMRQISGLYQQIGQIGMQPIIGDIEMMGNSYTRVSNDIKRATLASNGSIQSLQAQRGAWQALRTQIDPASAGFQRASREIEQLDRRLGKLQQTQGRRMGGMQMAQAAGAAISGGIFGGPEGFLGGAIGGIAGGVGGAFVGAAAGAQVGMLRQQLGGFADYAAQLQKMQIALKGAAGTQEEFNRAVAAANSVVRNLNVPQDVAIQGMTQLTAAVKGAGGEVSDAELVFKNITSAIKATGGSAQDVDGAITAMVQVFSKGKVSAEEISGQLGERLPGAVTKFAKANNMTLPEFQKQLEQGRVGLREMMNFIIYLGNENTEVADKIAKSSQDAGARLTVAYNDMRISIGEALQPVGAQLQETFARFVTDIAPAVAASAKAIADAFSFFLNNAILSGIAAFALKLGLVTAATVALRAAITSLAQINILSWFTGVTSAARVTGDVMAASAVKATGFATAMRGLFGILKSIAALGAITVAIDVVVRGFAQLMAARQALRELNAKRDPVGATGPQPVMTAERRYTGAAREKVIEDINKQREYAARLRKEIQDIDSQLLVAESVGAGRASLFTAGLKAQADLKRAQLRDAEEVIKLDLETFKTREQIQSEYLRGMNERFKTADGDGTGSGRTKKERESQLPQLLAELAVQQQIAQINEKIRNAQIAENQFLQIRLEGERELAQIAGEIQKIALEKIPADEAKAKRQLLMLKVEEARKNTMLRLQQAEKQDLVDITKQSDDLTESYTTQLEDRQRLQELVATGMKEALALEYIQIENMLKVEKERLEVRRALLLETGKPKEAQETQDLIDRLGSKETDLKDLAAAAQPEEKGKLQQFIEQAEAELKDFEALAVRISQNIGNAIGSSIANGITGLIEGTTTAKEIFASFLKDVGQILIQEGAKMIATYIAIGIARAFAGLQSSTTSSTGPNPGGIPSTGNVTAPSVNGFDTGSIANIAANGAYFDNGTAYFAKGGIVTRPTFFKYAKGGEMQNGLMGEAGPEAIVPLKRGPDGRLGISMYSASRNAVASAEANAGSNAGDYQEELAIGGTSATRRSLAASAAQAVMATRTQVSEQRSISERRSEMRQIQEIVAKPAKINVEFQSQVINNVEYVTRDQAERMAAQSALRGRELAIGSLQNSVKTRKRVGMA